MNYTTKVTMKGQVTIPKEIRDVLDIDNRSTLVVSLDDSGKGIKMTTCPDFLEMAGIFKAKNKRNVLSARESFEKNYERS